VAESWAFGNRVVIEDSRADGSYLRVTWHPDGRKFVVSHWRDDVCLAATRVEPAAVPDLISLLARGLGEMALETSPPTDVAFDSQPSGSWTRARRWFKDRLPAEWPWRRSA
jgi:hypothetical protein